MMSCLCSWLFCSNHRKPPLRTSEQSLRFQVIENDHSNPKICTTDTAIQIYDDTIRFRKAEIKKRPNANYMDTIQHDIYPTMRGNLINWLVSVAQGFKLDPETLYLTVSCVDRFLSSRFVTQQQLQLLVISCMVIAAKYEESKVLNMDTLCKITDDAYCRKEVLEMERKVLDELKFELTAPTTNSFLRIFVRVAQASCKGSSSGFLEFLGDFLAELTLVEYGFLSYLPSMIAASAVYLAKITLDSSVCPWDATLEHYTGYKASELESCVRAIHKLQLISTERCAATQEKYMQEKFKCVATLAPLAALPRKYFKDLV